MSDPLNAQDFIRTSEPGTMIYCAGEAIGGPRDGEHFTELLIRERPDSIAKLGQNPVIELRAALFAKDTPVAIAVMLKIRNDLYESWWNYHQPSGPEDFERMRQQTLLPISFHSRYRIERRIAISNQQLGKFFGEAIHLIQSRPAWTMKDFDHARSGVESLYPTIVSLWENLGLHLRIRLRAN